MKSIFSAYKYNPPNFSPQKSTYLAVCACLCALLVNAAPGAAAQELHAGFHAAKGYRTHLEVSHGLRIVTFRTPEGQIQLNLPDDLRASETVVGTMRLKPKGLSDAERTSTPSTLATYHIQLGAESHAVDESPQAWTVPSIDPPGLFRVTLLDAGNHAEAQADLQVAPLVDSTRTETGETKFLLPRRGVVSTPFTISGPVGTDGLIYRVRIGDGEARLLAASTRELIVESTSVPGKSTLHLRKADELLAETSFQNDRITRSVNPWPYVIVGIVTIVVIGIVEINNDIHHIAQGLGNAGNGLQ